MSSQPKILPYTSQPKYTGGPVEILNSVFATVNTGGAALDIHEKALSELSEKAIAQNGNVLLCLKENPLGNGSSIFSATAAKFEPKL